MSPDDAGKYIDDHILVTREDIARAKAFIVALPNGNADSHCGMWLNKQEIEEPKAINTDASDVEDTLASVARAYSLRKAFFQALFELSACGEIIFTRELSEWKPNLGYRTPRGAGGIDIKTSSPMPTRFERLALPDGIQSDPDIFLDGVDCKHLHSGIHEAIDQARPARTLGRMGRAGKFAHWSLICYDILFGILDSAGRNGHGESGAIGDS